MGISGAVGGFTSTIYLPSLPVIAVDLQASNVTVTLTMSLFVLCLGIGPVLCATVSDTYHTRRAINIVTLSIFVLCSALGYVVPSVGLLILIRILQALGASGAISTGFGAVSDFYPPQERGAAMGFVASMVTIGPLLGPILGGYISAAWGWRMTFVVTACVGGVFLIMQILFVPESFRDVKRWGDGGTPVSSTDEESKGLELEDSRTATLTEETVHVEEAKMSGGKQVHPLLIVFRMLGIGFVFFTSLCASVGFAVMFATETVIPDLYLEVYGLTSSQTGLTYLAGGVMNILSSIVAGRSSDYFYHRAIRKRAETSPGMSGEHLGTPEDRFTPWTFVNCFVVVPLGTLLFGWSIWARLHIGVPIAAFGVICFGFSDSMLTSSAYLVDSTAKFGRSASATSAMNMFRMVFACVLSFVATPWVQAIGVQWLSTLFAVLSILSGLGLMAMKIKGSGMRERASSLFA
ncbi:major facilitator superfamily domain-containing protein [Cladochytrium replicatum]|nr:major facilitator superfamily domain-containing protein [Cladochytrium replicatum]